MFVRERSDAWQIVLQPDHADLAAQFVRAWAPRPEPFASLEVVARRHDDGWAVWERAPGLDAESRPMNFLAVPVPVHLAFYRAGIAAVTDHDPYAGLMLSMHGAGIYNGRYGTQPELRMALDDDARDLVAAFVEEQEQGYGERIAQLGVSEDERWRNYKLLQVWDRLAIYFSWSDVEEGERASIGPLQRNGDESSLEIEPRGPWRVALEPFPFVSDQASFTLLRRLVPKRAWPDENAFRGDFFATPVESVTIVAERV